MSVPSKAGSASSVSAAVENFNWRPALLLLLAMGLYSALFDKLGFIASSALFLYTGFVVLGEKRHALSAGVALALVLFLWAILTQAFGLYLDPGELYRYVADAFS